MLLEAVIVGITLLTVAPLVVGLVQEHLRGLCSTLSRLQESVEDVAAAVQAQTTRWRPTVPPRADLRLLEPLAPSTQTTYRRTLRGFTQWLTRTGQDFTDGPSLDSTVVDYILETGLRITAAESTVAAVEKVMPTAGKLVYARGMLRTLQAQRVRVYTTPLPWSLCLVIAYDWAQSGWPRAASALLLQWVFGLRPSEALALRGQDCLPSSVAEAGGFTRMPTVLLQSTYRTMAGRPQFALALQPWRAVADIILHAVRASTPDNTRVSNLPTVTHVTSFLRRSRRRLQLNGDFTAHSPRPGWATESRLRGIDFSEIQEAGRWVSGSSLRQYLDVTAILLSRAEEPRFSSFARYLLDHLAGRFPWAQ